MRNPPASVVLSIAVVAISFAAIFFRLAAPAEAVTVACGRLLIAAFFYLPFTLRAGTRVSSTARRGAALGGVFYAIHFGTWATSLELTSVAASVTLVTATPLLLALVALTTGKDKPERRHYLAIGLAFVGVLLIARSDSSQEGALMGDALALVGAAAMAGYMLVVRAQGPKLDILAFSGVATSVAALILLGVCLAFGFTGPVPSHAIGYMLLLALVPQLLGHLLLTWALKRTRPTVVGIATVGEPAVSTLLAYLWLGESVALATLIGCLVTAAAVLLALGTRSDRPAQAA